MLFSLKLIIIIINSQILVCILWIIKSKINTVKSVKVFLKNK